jgi:hypothetical protein
MELVIVCAERDEGPYRGNGLLSDLIKEFSTSELRALPVRTGRETLPRGPALRVRHAFLRE